MKRMKKFAAILTAAVMLASHGIAATCPGTSAFAADDTQDDWLHVEGDKVVDMNGNEVWMTGVNWFGYNVGSQVFDGVWNSNLHKDLQDIADHGFNLLRVPMSTEILIQWKNKKPDSIIKVGEWENPELTIEGVAGGTPKYSLDVWNQAVEWCKECGIKIMIDIHCATTNAGGHTYPLWYDENFGTKDWLTALEWFCDTYKNDDTIIAIDLKNEPHGKPEEGKFAKWDESKDENNWKYAAERGAEACLSGNPNLLIMVEGIECYPDFDRGADWTTPSVDYAHYGEPSKVFGAWWGGNLRGVKKLPLDEKLKSHIVYSPHDYGPLVHPQSWFHLVGQGNTISGYDFDRQSLLDEYWLDTWAYICEENIAPLLMGEWGGFIDKEHDGSGANQEWMKVLRDYMIEKHIHHTFWCYNWNSGDTGGLVLEDMTTWDMDKYNLVKPALWQDENGVFISLDHKYKVGANGQSLSEYYSGTHTNPPVTKTTTATTATTTVTTATTLSETVKTTSETTATTTVSQTVSTSTSGPAEEWYRLGDANLDKSVDVSDAVLVAKFSSGDSSAQITDHGLVNADCDGKKGVDSDDITVILKYIAKLIDETGLKAPQ